MAVEAPRVLEDLPRLDYEFAETREPSSKSAPITLSIPATLQDSLEARLDGLGAFRELAQLAATLGREFSYELLEAVSPLDPQVLEEGLRRLTEHLHLQARPHPGDRLPLR